ncbi:MAG: HPr family phosphocarrier protein [Butyricicoccus sp.]|nr:HPr family phosphocarrier protein [Butyricicoccus sp.]
MTRAIRVKNTEDIQKINKIVTKFPFDVWIHGKSGMVDAKSLLGMFLLSLNEPLRLVIEDDIDAKQVKKLFNDLEDYLDIEDDDE